MSIGGARFVLYYPFNYIALNQTGLYNIVDKMKEMGYNIYEARKKAEDRHYRNGALRLLASV